MHALFPDHYLSCETITRKDQTVHVNSKYILLFKHVMKILITKYVKAVAIDHFCDLNGIISSQFIKTHQNHSFDRESDVLRNSKNLIVLLLVLLS